MKPPSAAGTLDGRPSTPSGCRAVAHGVGVLAHDQRARLAGRPAAMLD